MCSICVKWVELNEEASDPQQSHPEGSRRCAIKVLFYFGPIFESKP